MTVHMMMAIAGAGLCSNVHIAIDTPIISHTVLENITMMLVATSTNEKHVVL